MVQRIINGSSPQKMARSWRLESQISRIQQALKNFKYISTSYVLCEGNKFADWLANYGANPPHKNFKAAWSNLRIKVDLDPREMQDLQKLIHKDLKYPNGGVQSSRQVAAGWSMELVGPTCATCPT